MVTDVALTWPAGSVAVTWILFEPVPSGTAIVNAPLPSAAPATVAFVVTLRRLSVLRAWVFPTTDTVLALTTASALGELIVIFGFVVSRMWLTAAADSRSAW